MSEPRPLHHLRILKQRAPDLWRAVAEARSRASWPHWCYLPIPETVEFESLEGGFAEATALATWRATQGIYRIHPEMLHAIAQTESHGKIPAEIFWHLPEWCIYVETPGIGLAHGFFVHLNWTGLAAELCFVMDGAPLDMGLLHQDGVAELAGMSQQELESTLSKTLWPVYFELSAEKTLEETMGDTIQDAMARKLSHTPAARRTRDQMQQWLDSGHMKLSPLAKMLRPYLAITLYLCSQSAEYLDNVRPPRPRPVKTRKGMKLFPPDKPRVWEVGYRMGAALQAARAGTAAASDESGSRTVRPHIRRAHWHLYWTGPRSSSQKPVLKWLPPIPIAVEDLEQIVPVVRPA